MFFQVIILILLSLNKFDPEITLVQLGVVYVYVYSLIVFPFGVCQVTEECETYLGLLILHLMTEGHEEQAWNLLNCHLSHCGFPLPLTISLLVPLARFLVKHSHSKQCPNIKVRNIQFHIFFILDFSSFLLICGC